MAIRQLQGGRVLLGRALVPNQGVIFDTHVLQITDRSRQLETDSNLYPTVETEIIPENWILAPGFVDVHIHGMAGADVMDGRADSLEIIAKALVKTGVTSWLGTTMTESIPRIQKALRVAADFANAQTLETGACLEGIHLEGPYLNPAFKGAQDPTYLLPLDLTQFERDFYQAAPGLIKQVTLAPELNHSESFIQALTQKRIVVALGHSAATLNDAKAAERAGAKHLTHLFNAMSGIHHREPGLAGAGLLTPLSLEWIADDIHLRPEWYELLLTHKQEKAILVTDAMCAATLAPGDYALGGQAVIVDGTSARLKSGALAGSVLTMDRAVKNVVSQCPNLLAESLYAASTAPAKLIGLEGKGAIDVGGHGDFVLLDEALNVRRVYRDGMIVFRNED